MLYSCHTKDRQHSHHTQREQQQYRWGAREARAPSVLLLARAQRAPLCVWCECWRSFVWHEYSIHRIYRIYKIYRIYRVCRVFRLYRVYRVYTVYRAYRIYSFGTRGFQKNAFFYVWKYYFNACFCMFGLFFRPRDPSKKLRHVVRINLVQFSAPELH